MAFPSSDIKKLVASGYPVIYLVSFDENYIEKNIQEIGQQLLGENYNFKLWSAESIEKGSDTADSLEKALNSIDTGFLFVKDLNFYIDDPKVIRTLKDFYNSRIGKPGKHIVIVSSSLFLPPEIEKEITVVDIPLPDFEETKQIFDSIISEEKYSELSSQITPDIADKCIHGLLGLGAAEMELALKRSMVGKKSIDDDFVDDIILFVRCKTDLGTV